MKGCLRRFLCQGTPSNCEQRAFIWRACSLRRPYWYSTSVTISTSPERQSGTKSGGRRPQVELMPQSLQSSEEHGVLIVINALLLLLISSWQGPAPSDGPRPRIKCKASFLEVAHGCRIARVRDSLQSAGASCEGHTSTPSSSQVPR